ncbi:MAG: hypothetical protein ABSG43_21405 [Solirubrobacteraceae bacterium]
MARVGYSVAVFDPKGDHTASANCATCSSPVAGITSSPEPAGIVRLLRHHEGRGRRRVAPRPA